METELYANIAATFGASVAIYIGEAFHIGDGHPNVLHGRILRWSSFTRHFRLELWPVDPRSSLEGHGVRCSVRIFPVCP